MIVWPVYTYLVFMLISLGYVIARHGDTYKINAWGSIISTSIILFLLYKGGFFDVLIK